MANDHICTDLVVFFYSLCFATVKLVHFRYLQKLPLGFSQFVPAGLRQFESSKEDGAYLAGRNSNRRGRGREQGSGNRSQRRISGSRTDVSRRNGKNGGSLSQGIKQQGRRVQGRGGRGRRTVRRRRPEKSAVTDNSHVQMVVDTVDERSNGGSYRDMAGDWSGRRIRIKTSETVNRNISPEDESEDDAQEPPYEQENWEPDFVAASGEWNREHMDMSDEDVDASEDDNSIEEAGDEDAEGYMDIGEGSDVGNRLVNDERLESSDSSESEDYSD